MLQTIPWCPLLPDQICICCQLSELSTLDDRLNSSSGFRAKRSVLIALSLALKKEPHLIDFCRAPETLLWSPEAPDRCEPCLLSQTTTTECPSLILLDVMGGCNGTKLLLERANLKGKVLLWDMYVCALFYSSKDTTQVSEF